MMPGLATLQARVQAKMAADAATKAAKKDPRKAPVALELQSRAAWRTVGVTLLLDAWACRCGGHGRGPTGMFLLQEHIYLANSTRLIACDAEHPVVDGLPRRVESHARAVQWCAECAEEYGFRSVGRQTAVQAPAEPEQEELDHD